MKLIIKLTLWFYSFLPESTIEEAARKLFYLVHQRQALIKERFRKTYPNYRDYTVDPLPPLTKPEPQKPSLDFKQLLSDYKAKYGKDLKPVKTRDPALRIPSQAHCAHCNAPHNYLYYNDGKKRSQLKCKVCSHLFQLEKRYQKSAQTPFYCPHCSHKLYLWKQNSDCTIYKCGNEQCPNYLKNLAALNPKERAMMKTHSSQFKLWYQFREYHIKPDDLKTLAPEPSTASLSKIHRSLNTLCLALSFHVSFGLTARKTSLILKQMFGINLSYQTVLNYTQIVAPYFHKFNLSHKGNVDSISVGDETYIKILGKNHYTWFFMSPSNHSITSYHISDNRGTKHAIISMNEAMRSIPKDKSATFVTDGNPSYISASVYFNTQYPSSPSVQHHKVIGLQNLDSDSEKYRPFKQMIERLNRTYKHHVRPAHGFNTMNGAASLTTLFVSHYNYLRPHISLNGDVPIKIPQLDSIPFIQGKWSHLLKLALKAV